MQLGDAPLDPVEGNVGAPSFALAGRTAGVMGPQRTAENAADLRQFAAEEKRCCEFWGFEVIGAPSLMLRWDGPPELADYMDQVVEYFEGRAPIGTLFGSRLP